MSHRKFFRTDVEGVDREAASTEWEKTRRSRRCGVRGVFLLRKRPKADDVVGAVEEGHEALFAAEALVYQQILFVVSHGVTEVDGFDRPTVAFKFFLRLATKAAKGGLRGHDTSGHRASTLSRKEILVVDGIV